MTVRSPTDPARDERLRRAAVSLLQDRATAEAGRLLLEAGIPAILLKGPTFARWLYGPAESRPYCDTDLLVPRARYRAAGRVLRRAGYRPETVLIAWRHEHATPWARHRDGANIDLHHMLGLMDQAIDPWPVLVHHTEPIVVAGEALTGLSEPARCLHAALHAARNPRLAKPVEDLRRAVGVAGPAAWEEAAALSRRLRCEGEFAAGLATAAAGVELAVRLGVVGRPSSRLRSLGSVGSERTWTRLVTQQTWGGRVSLLIDGVWPGRLRLRRRYRWAGGPMVAAALVVDDARKLSRLVRGARQRRTRGDRSLPVS